MDPTNDESTITATEARAGRQHDDGPELARCERCGTPLCLDPATPREVWAFGRPAPNWCPVGHGLRCRRG